MISAATTAAAIAFGSTVLLITQSPAFGVAAGIIAKHSLECSAKKLPVFGARLTTRLAIGPFSLVVALGFIESLGHINWITPGSAVANAIAALIGFAGPEVVIALVISHMRKRGWIGDDFKNDEV